MPFSVMPLLKIALIHHENYVDIIEKSLTLKKIKNGYILSLNNYDLLVFQPCL